MRIVLVGAGGHARVVLDILRYLPHEVLGVVDDDPIKTGTTVGGIPVLGTSGALPWILREGLATGAIVAIGHNKSRSAKAQECEALGFELLPAVHPTAAIGIRVTVGEGSVIMAGAVVNCDTFIGSNVVINTGATIDHDGLISDGCHISPGAHIAGNVHLDDLVHIGLGASVVPNVRIGAASVVGAGAVVLGDVPSGEVWAGNPAKRLRRIGESTVRSGN